MIRIKHIFLFTFLFLTVGNLFSQETETKDFKVGVSGGFAFYFEGDLQKLNNQIINATPFDVKMLDDFPPYFCYGGYILSQLWEKIAVGPAYNFYTTGSRLGAKDYSGSYSFDQIISAHSLGIQLELLMAEKNKTKIYFENIVGAHFATWKMEENLILDEIEQNDLQELRAVKPFIYPGVKFLWPLTNKIKMHAKAGVSIDLGGKFSLKENSQAKSETKVNFSGPKITLGFEYGN